MVDKALIRSRFTSAIPYYDTEATVQQEIVELLGQYLKSFTLPNKGTILELGCGTGALSQHLVQRFGSSHSVVLNDLCEEVYPAIVAKVGREAQFRSGDAEHDPWEEECALIAAASCIQWWDNPMHFYDKSYTHLCNGGYLLFSTFGEQNMKELRHITGKGLTYHSTETIKEHLKSLGFKDIQIEERTFKVTFPSLTDLLRHLKRTGVNATTPPTRWTPTVLKEAEETYRRYYADHKGLLPLTYHAILGYTHK